MRRNPLLPLPLAVAVLVACVSAPPSAGAATPDVAQLAAYHWQLAEATNHQGQRITVLFVRPDKPLQLDFTDGRLSVRNACNGMGGSYRIENGRLMVGPMMHTMIACADPALNRLDGLIGHRLARHPAIAVTEHDGAPQLQLRTTSGDTLAFTGVPTPETRYGGPGMTEFLEVAAKTVPCQQNQSCLSVRVRSTTTPPGSPPARRVNWMRCRLSGASRTMTACTTSCARGAMPPATRPRPTCSTLWWRPASPSCERSARRPSYSYA